MHACHGRFPVVGLARIVGLKTVFVVSILHRYNILAILVIDRYNKSLVIFKTENSVSLPFIVDACSG